MVTGGMKEHFVRRCSTHGYNLECKQNCSVRNHKAKDHLGRPGHRWDDIKRDHEEIHSEIMGLI
jgi:hypothetical protein